MFHALHQYPQLNSDGKIPISTWPNIYMISLFIGFSNFFYIICYTHDCLHSDKLLYLHSVFLNHSLQLQTSRISYHLLQFYVLIINYYIITSTVLMHVCVRVCVTTRPNIYNACSSEVHVNEIETTAMLRLGCGLRCLRRIMRMSPLY